MTTAHAATRRHLTEDAAISAAVRALLDDRGESVTALSYHTSISVASLYRKLAGGCTARCGDGRRLIRAAMVPLMRLLTLAALSLLAGCGGSDAPAARPGSSAVYEQIESSEDCAGLQETFDRAAANNDGAEPGSDEHKWTLGYMEAADERMRAVGCY